MAWYEDLFDETYLETYDLFLTPERTQGEVDGLVTLVGLDRPQDILDIPCGQGRHSIELARRGHRVTGVDLSDTLLSAARQRSSEAGVDVEWLQADMREITFEDEFDLAVNLFTSFGYMEDEEEDQRFLQAVYRALRPGGRLVMEMMHKYGFLCEYGGDMRSWFGDDGRYTLEDTEFNPETDRAETERTVVIDGETHQRTVSLRLYSYKELQSMLTTAGFTVDGAYGGLDGESLEVESFRLVVTAVK